MPHSSRLRSLAPKERTGRGPANTMTLVRMCAGLLTKDVYPLMYLYALLGGSVLLLTLSCATPHATLAFNAPSVARAGIPFSVTVNVIYQGKPDTVINSPVHFTSSDPAATLPPDYYFTTIDAGSHTWTNGFVLMTPGNQTISGYILDASGVTPITGNADISISP